VKVFISFDMEGVAGIVDWSQCRGPGQPYEEGRRLLLGEVNAAIDGAVAGGATEIVCNDSHGTMNNLDPAELHGEAAYVSGRHKPLYMMQGLDGTADVVFMVGYHGSISGESSVLSHTYNPAVISQVLLNGTPAGESGINALVALACQAPVGLITGDQHTISQAGPFLPDAERVVVKESFTRFAASSLHPEAARRLIFDGARRAMERAVAQPSEVWEIAAGRSGGAPRGQEDGADAEDSVDEPVAVLGLPAISLPVTMEVHVQTADMAEVASWVRGVERTGVRTVSIRGDDPMAVFRSFVGLTYITRQSEGRLGGLGPHPAVRGSVRRARAARGGPRAAAWVDASGSGGRAGGSAGDLVAAPAGEGGVPVEREDHIPVGRLRRPLLGRHPPHDLELDAARILGVQGLGYAVVGLPHQRPGRQQPRPYVGQVPQRADLPGQVVEPRVFGPVGRAAGADLEQAEVVVVGRARCAQERGPAGDLRPDLEAEGLPVKVNGALKAVHVKNGVVETADGHRRSFPGGTCRYVQVQAGVRHSQGLAGPGRAG
jgi:D-amino peptidase